jgi:futalosine hydrolase
LSKGNIWKLKHWAQRFSAELWRMRVVITSATTHESQLIRNKVSDLYTSNSTRLKLSFHTSGVGILASCFSLQKMMNELKPDLVIQAGIAGSFTPQLHLTQVVAVRNECVGDLGVEENGNFIDLFDMRLQNDDEFPFRHKKLENPWLAQFNLIQLKEVPAVTISEVSTRKDRIMVMQHKYGVAIESMEGAALHYAGLCTQTPFIQIRAISNFVGERNKENWRMQDALENLSMIVVQYIDKLYQVK